MGEARSLPPGQREREDFPRFGLTQFADRVPDVPESWRLEIHGDVDGSGTLDPAALAGVPRTRQVSDFHCVTTWSYCRLRWRGWSFRELYEGVIAPRFEPHRDVRLVVFEGLDGYCVSLPLRDALGPDVLLADELDDAALSVEHGAPLRLVAPRHYGYKSAKHLRAIGLWTDARGYRRPTPWLMDHPRARVDHEERGNLLPGWIFRYWYRPSIDRAVRQSRDGLRKAGKGPRA